MLFKDTKPNYIVHFLDKEKVRHYTGKVVSVSPPRIEMAGGTGFASTQMVVDVTIQAEGATRTYAIPETGAVTYAGQLVLSTDKDGVTRELEAMKTAAEEALAQMERHREVAGRAATLLEELNPALAERKAQDRRIEGIENEVRSIGQQLRDFINEFKK
jgi:hypothetical protein